MNPPSSKMPPAVSSDDEALARMLQFQEQSNLSLPTHAVVNGYAAVASSAGLVDRVDDDDIADQERRDLALARDMMEADLLASGASSTAGNNNYGFENRIGECQGQQEQDRQNLSYMSGSTTAALATNHQEFDSDLEMARRIQEQEELLSNVMTASRTGTQSNNTQMASSNNGSPMYHPDSDNARSDRDAKVSRLVSMMDDTALAQLMTSTGRSLRDLNEDELMDAMFVMQGSKGEQGDASATAIDHLTARSMARSRAAQSDSPSPSPRKTSRSKLRQASTRVMPTTSQPGIATTAGSSASAAIPSPPPPSNVELARRNTTTSTTSRRNLFGNFRGQAQSSSSAAKPTIPGPIPDFAAAIPAAIPPPPSMGGPKRHHKPGTPCAKCGLTEGTFLKAKDKHYHPECFRCHFCHEKIDVHSKFGFKRGEPDQPNSGHVGGSRARQLNPYHAECYAIAMSQDSQCVVCQNPIPMGDDGKICFIKHPFFQRERICPSHVENDTNGQRYNCRRCTGCHRFEPVSAPFVDLYDGRCVCYACCRTSIMDGSDLFPLWQKVVSFFEHDMSLPVSDEFRNLPVLVVGLKEFEEYQKDCGRRVASSSPSHIIAARGLCLVENSGKSTGSEATTRLKMPAMRFNQSSSSFEAIHSEGYEYYDLPPAQESRVFAIMCLSGLPSDLTACILAHAATHAWVRLHPEYDNLQASLISMDTQAQEGVAQLVTMLFLTQGGLEKLLPSQEEEDWGVFPSREQAREYYQFCIETDVHELYGKGYRRAAHCYQEVGIQALMIHLVRYGTLPSV